MGSPVELFLALVGIGILLIAIEVFLPGGVVGVLGACSLIAAVITGFYAFGPQGGMLAALAVILVSGTFLVIWIKVFPKTRVGRVLTLTFNEKSFTSGGEQHDGLLNKEGTALTNLRPAGKAQFAGQRVDVVSESGYIDQGARVRVLQVEGMRVVVKEVKSGVTRTSEST